MSAHQPTTIIDPRDRLDRSIWNHLTGIDARLLDELAFLSRCQARKSPRGATYCTPGRKYLARRLACTPTTISRRTSRLQRLGILFKTQRRPVAGRWQTCLYRVIHPAGWAMARLRLTIRRITHRVTPKSHLAFPQKGIRQQKAEGGTFGATSADIKARAGP